MRTTAFAIAATAAGAYALPQFQQSHVDNASQTIINDLKSHKLNRLASLLTSNMDVAEQITASPGEKLFLAPDNDAVAALPQYVLGHQGQLRATLLQHVFNGSFPIDQIPNAPKHAVGYSFLTDGNYAAQPGGNGLPVSLAKRGDDAPFDVFEGMNLDRVTEIPFKISNGITVAPIAHAITVPGKTSFTLDFVTNQKQLVQLLSKIPEFSASDLDQFPGVTVFVPKAEVFQRAASSLVDNEKLGSTVVMQHIVQNRALFTPLMRTQGSMVNAAGQDVYYDPSDNSVRVGKSKAHIVQSDIVSSNGVIHMLDNILLDVNMNETRRDQAALSARKSYHGPVAGFVQADNAGSTQGPNIPGPDAHNPAQGFTNSNVQGNSDGSSTTGTSGPNGAGKDPSNGNRNSDGNNGNGNNQHGNGDNNKNGNGNKNAASSMHTKSAGLLAAVGISAAVLL